MSFTTQDLNTTIPGVVNTSLQDLPSKVFTGFDPNGTTTITGSQRVVPEPNVKQAKITEGAAAETVEPKEESVTLSPKLSALARREQAHRQREQALKQKEQALAEKLAKADRFEALQSKIAAKDYSAAEELGLKYDEYTEHLVQKQAKEDPAAERVHRVEQQLEAMKKAEEERVIKDYQANQALWKAEVSRVVASSEDYSTIKELSAEDIVLAHINDSFEEDGVELTAEQAAKEIEAALVERAEKLASISKLKNRAEAPRKLGAPKTITQNMTVSSEKPVRKPFHLMSDSEQIAEAIRRVNEAKQQR